MAPSVTSSPSATVTALSVTATVPPMPVVTRPEDPEVPTLVMPMPSHRYKQLYSDWARVRADLMHTFPSNINSAAIFMIECDKTLFGLSQSFATQCQALVEELE
jgi:hypothetical protein